MSVQNIIYQISQANNPSPMKSEMLHPSGTGAPVQFLSGSGANRLFNLLYRLNVNYTSLRKPMLFLFLLALSLTSTLKISAQCNP